VQISICDRNAPRLFVCTRASKESRQFYIPVPDAFFRFRFDISKQHNINFRIGQRKHLCARHNTYKNVRSLRSFSPTTANGRPSLYGRATSTNSTPEIMTARTEVGLLRRQQCCQTLKYENSLKNVNNAVARPSPFRHKIIQRLKIENWNTENSKARKTLERQNPSVQGGKRFTIDR